MHWRGKGGGGDGEWGREGEEGEGEGGGWNTEIIISYQGVEDPKLPALVTKLRNTYQASVTSRETAMDYGCLLTQTSPTYASRTVTVLLRSRVPLAYLNLSQAQLTVWNSTHK